MVCTGRTPLLAIVLLLGAGGLSGCAPFLNPTLLAMAQAQRSPLPSAVPQNAVEIEVFFIERPPGDPLSGETLWNELDQIGSVDAATRERLRSNGLRFGISGRTLPYALQALTSHTFDDGPGHRTTRQQYQTPSGVTHQFPCGDLPNPAVLRLATADGLQEIEYAQGRGVIRCRVEKTQAGWATLDVLPTIHHGENKLRHSATDTRWDLNRQQAVDTLYAQRFSVTLNDGESLVLGAVGDQIDSAGGRLFRGGQSAEPMTRLLVIRLKSLDQINPVLNSAR